MNLQQRIFELEQENERLRSLLSEEETEEEQDIPVLIGKLNKPFGIKGYDIAEVGHDVYETKHRYIINLTSSNPKILPVAVPFYKATLKPDIDFNE
jgi:hypothetical protein